MSTEFEVKYTRRNEIEEARPLEVQMALSSEQRKGGPEMLRRLEEEAWD